MGGGGRGVRGCRLGLLKKRRMRIGGQQLLGWNVGRLDVFQDVMDFIQLAHNCPRDDVKSAYQSGQKVFLQSPVFVSAGDIQCKESGKGEDEEYVFRSPYT